MKTVSRAPGPHFQLSGITPEDSHSLLKRSSAVPNRRETSLLPHHRPLWPISAATLNQIVSPSSCLRTLVSYTMFEFSKFKFNSITLPLKTGPFGRVCQNPAHVSHIGVHHAHHLQISSMVLARCFPSCIERPP